MEAGQVVPCPYVPRKKGGTELPPCWQIPVGMV